MVFSTDDDYEEFFEVNKPADARPAPTARVRIGFVNPHKITDYRRSQEELEEFLLFCVLVAGKDAWTTSWHLQLMLRTLHDRARLGEFRPFESLRRAEEAYGLAERLQNHGFGCFNQKARAIHALIHSGMDLRSCSLEDLEAIPSVGPKTARFFLLHSRRGQRLAVLDVHVLRFLRSRGVKAPKDTPPKGPRYLALEKVFLRLADEAGMTPARFDLRVWREAQ
jgi:thermostable 8-oxoguanine DNA glycosylase